MVASLESRLIKIVDTVNLEYRIKVRTSTPRPCLNPDDNYTITLYEEFDSLVGCDICNTRESKTSKRVTIRNEQTHKLIVSGMDCLKINFGVTEKDLNLSSKDIKRLARTWQNLVPEEFSEMASASTTSEALEKMELFLEQTVSFRGIALNEAVNLIKFMRNDTSGITEGKYNQQIAVLETYLGLQKAHRNDRKRFLASARSLISHPNATKDIREYFKRFFSDLERNTWKDMQLFHRNLTPIQQKRSLPYKLREVSPINYPNQNSYLFALRSHMQDRANNESDLNQMIQVNNISQFVEQSLNNLQSEIRRNLVQVFNIADTSKESVDELALSRSLIHQLDRKGYFYTFSTTSQAFEKSEITMLNPRSAGEMFRESQLNQEEQNRLEQGRAENRGLLKGFKKSLIIWKPDEWYEAYGCWYDYGGELDGRRILENFLTN